jgi:mono/diheme cytochrome c family protein
VALVVVEFLHDHFALLAGQRTVGALAVPDGSLYVVDMYRGIIQQADFMTEFLRKESIDRELAAPINLGRIYRIKSTQTKDPLIPKFSNLSPVQWVELLNHPNGWVRDRAQQWLIWQRPTEAIEPLKTIARGSAILPVIHALWTLDGLGEDTFSLSVDRISDSHQKLATVAMTTAARSANTHERIHKLVTILSGHYNASTAHAFHAILALGAFDLHSKRDLYAQIANEFSESPNIREALFSGLNGNEWEFLNQLMAAPEWNVVTPGKQLLIQGLASCATRGGKMNTIHHLIETSRSGNWEGNAIKEGMVVALLERKAPLKVDFDPKLDDPRFDSLLAWPGHEGPKPSANAARPLTQKERSLYVKGQTIYSGLCASCHGADGRGMTPLAPPLVNSEWVMGDPDRLARILLHGLEGPIQVAGKHYEPPQILPAMPPVGMMSNDELAAVMTYIRRAWDHQADPVTGGDIQRNRDLTTTQEGAYRTSDW